MTYRPGSLESEITKYKTTIFKEDDYYDRTAKHFANWGFRLAIDLLIDHDNLKKDIITQTSNELIKTFDDVVDRSCE